MRSLLLAAAALAIVVGSPTWTRAEEGCTGPNCQTPAQGGGHECERQKKEDAVS